jgi:hypothetical protein
MTKSWSWSFSKLKNYDTCPKRHYEVDLAKNYSDEGGEALVWGNEVHGALAAAIKNKTPLPDTMRDYQKWVDRVLDGPGELQVEKKYAITKDFQPTSWFADNAWYRGIGDVVRIDGPVALILDWKTGKVLVDSVQLMLMAQCIFAHFPNVKVVRSEYVWLKDDCSTPEIYTRADVAGGWVGLLPRIKELENAAVTMTYPPKPGKLCYKWCPVMSCPFHGKSHR